MLAEITCTQGLCVCQQNIIATHIMMCIACMDSRKWSRQWGRISVAMLTWFLYIDPRVVWFKLKRNLDRGHINPSQVKSPDTSWRFPEFSLLLWDRLSIFRCGSSYYRQPWGKRRHFMLPKWNPSVTPGNTSERRQHGRAVRALGFAIWGLRVQVPFCWIWLR